MQFSILQHEHALHIHGFLTTCTVQAECNNTRCFEVVLLFPQSATCSLAKYQGTTHPAMRLVQLTHSVRLTLNPQTHQHTAFVTGNHHQDCAKSTQPVVNVLHKYTIIHYHSSTNHTTLCCRSNVSAHPDFAYSATDLVHHVSNASVSQLLRAPLPARHVSKALVSQLLCNFLGFRFDATAPNCVARQRRSPWTAAQI